jgi:hypothetical protein
VTVHHVDLRVDPLDSREKSRVVRSERRVANIPFPQLTWRFSRMKRSRTVLPSAPLLLEDRVVPSHGHSLGGAHSGAGGRLPAAEVGAGPVVVPNAPSPAHIHHHDRPPGHADVAARPVSRARSRDLPSLELAGINSRHNAFFQNGKKARDIRRFHREERSRFSRNEAPKHGRDGRFGSQFALI